MENLTNLKSRAQKALRKETERKAETMRFSVILRIALKNLQRRKSRAAVTIGGLSVAIALVIIMVSLGYGLQEMVVENFATLDALRTIDVTPEKSEQITLDNNTLIEFLELKAVDNALPIVELGAKMQYNGSVTDVAVIGLSKETFDNWTSLTVSDQSKIAEFDDSKAIASQTALNLVGANGDADDDEIAGKNITLDISVSGYASDREEISAEFEIIAVETNSEAPIVLVPIEFLQEEGINRYSRVKLTTHNAKDVQSTRLILEKMGFKTRTAQDTIDQIDDIFRMVRIGLATFGIVAGVVATLGMFNTLTVSLMEKTREIGIMKALGAQRNTVLSLFLVEAVIMSFSGGVLGILLGILTTQVIQNVLAGMARLQDHDLDSLFTYPIVFLLLVFACTMAVGFLTGFYPARKASKVNTLDALRYE